MNDNIKNEEIVGDVDQQYVPLKNYPAQVYTFSPYYFYSGYIYNANPNNTLQIQITPSYHSKLNPIIIPPNMALKIKNMSIQKIDIAQGYYTFSFIGSLYADGEPPQFDFDNFTIKTHQNIYLTIINNATYYSSGGFNLGSYLASQGYNIVNLKEKISFSLHVTSITSNTTLTLYIYGIDPQGNILTNAPLASSNPITAPTDEIINVDLYGFNNVNYIYVQININGSSGSNATLTLGLLAWGGEKWKMIV